MPCRRHGAGTAIAFALFALLPMSGSAPTCFDVDAALVAAANSAHAEFPFIGRKAYLTFLSNAACTRDPKSVNIIVAPKDSGKTRGLALAMREWSAGGALVSDQLQIGTFVFSCPWSPVMIAPSRW